ncbi:putative ATP-binding protein [Nitrosococcus halophilus Nc 4]|uniref:ATP-binding protein n=1 Tax=Nitrosococcus halophilus (strain Nc4) TaxID=472759 RepID=D5C4B7_NITHN|nr:ATP-binding protein [Nitrosococcus halophilus]ADE13305.1 putative ATP-binding protein [Nitrosococcus halophilus Nc 4]
MSLADCVHIARRFQRSVRIDTDLTKANALEGFICPKSSAEVLRTMANHVAETGQGAFTWTGPYGSGKSSLVIALSALLDGNNHRRKQAYHAIGSKAAEAVWEALPPKSKGWRILPVVGQKDHPAQVIGETLAQAKFWKGKAPKVWREQALISELEVIARQNLRSSGGLIVFLDEMGKFLEGAVHGDRDIYLFQQLAEVASRSNGRLIIVGILHQAFEEYAQRLSREMRDEWSKIQGRFMDLAVNTAGEEQLELLARAIEDNRRSSSSHQISQTVANLIRKVRPGASPHLEVTLEDCWPLNPIVATLLGPISRRRFGQNQRSIFGFLNSAEPQGFQDFLRHGSEKDLYNPNRLWDYLRLNLESSILASPDGHRWALAVEAVERCEGMGGDPLQAQLLKTIALVDLFKERSGLAPSLPLLKAAVPNVSSRRVEKAIKELERRSFIIFRKFADAYTIYAGSDFDIEQAVEQALTNIQDVDFAALRKLAGLHPILAKRHYHRTGALCWFDVVLVPLNKLLEEVSRFSPDQGTMGQFVLTLPTENEPEEVAEKLCRKAARQADGWDIVVGLSSRSWTIIDLAKELLAVEDVSLNHPELTGDAVARREVRVRIAALQGQLEDELHQAFDNTAWYLKHHPRKRLTQAQLSFLASDLANKRFHKAPRLHNELLNRIKPSSNAVAAQNALLRQMVMKEGEPRLGIDGFPAEGGLFASILEITGLYTETSHGWQFVAPHKTNDPCGLTPLWEAARDFLQQNRTRTVTVSEIYEVWRQPPLGLKEGLMPVLAVAFALSCRDTVAFYRRGIFQARLQDLDVDYLAKDPSAIQLRWMDLSKVSRRLLSGMADVVRDLDKNNSLQDLTPIDVARGLIAIYDQLPAWTKRTMRLSSNALRIRQLFKQANDPNKFLFDDIPALFGSSVDLTKKEGLLKIIQQVREGLSELRETYPTVLRRLRETLLVELQVPNDSPQALSELRARAENIRQLAGDFRLEAFINRMASYNGRDEEIEGLASLAANKPPRDWVDPDIDKAAIELSDMAQKFIRAEAFARVKGRPDKRQAMAVVVGVGGRPTPVLGEFDITDSERESVNTLISQMKTTLDAAEARRRNVILAALAELSARYLNAPDDEFAAEEKEIVGKKKVS